jgi:hypothetical protein
VIIPIIAPFSAFVNKGVEYSLIFFNHIADFS